VAVAVAVADSDSGQERVHNPDRYLPQLAWGHRSVVDGGVDE